METALISQALQYNYYIDTITRDPVWPFSTLAFVALDLPASGIPVCLAGRAVVRRTTSGLCLISIVTVFI